MMKMTDEGLGLSWDEFVTGAKNVVSGAKEVRDIVKGKPKAKAPAPVYIAPPSTILGMPPTTAMLAGAAMLAGLWFLTGKKRRG